MSKVENVNYTPAQEQLIRDRFASAGRPLNFEDCKAIAALAEMNDSDGEARKPRSIAAKISRMSDVEYARKEPTAKDGSPVVRKSDIVAEIARRADVSAKALETLEKASKPALVTLRDALTAVAA